MQDFKLVAIRPLKGCNKRFLKNLTAGQIYPFYNNYKFYNTDSRAIDNTSDNVCFISSNDSGIPDIYSVESADGSPLKISISAVVGRNGSGKSSLIELFFAAIYMYSIQSKTLEPNIDSLDRDSNRLRKDRRHQRKMENELTKDKNKLLKKAIPKDIVSDKDAYFKEMTQGYIAYSEKEKKIRHRITFIDDKLKENTVLKNEIKSFSKQLKAEIYFKIDSAFLRLKIDNNNENIVTIEEIPNLGAELSEDHKTEIPFEDMALPFYSVAVNYSHHALNSQFLGEWIKNLFLKNDGYTVPLVLNPMRKEGNFDINDEMNFARYRLLSNALMEEFSNPGKGNKVLVTDNQHIHKVRLSLNWPKILRGRTELTCRNDGTIASKYTRSINLFHDLMADYLTTEQEKMLNTVNFPMKEIIVNYILQKVEKIPKTYPWFGYGYEFSDNIRLIEDGEFLQAIKEDNSHITFKLKQAIYFLQYNLTVRDNALFAVAPEKVERKQKIEFEFSLGELISYMDDVSGSEIMQRLPPAIFDIDFILSNPLGSKSNFSALSSGEQQLIHSIQSVIYHLNNIQSVHLSNLEERIKYSSVNIVYDEIELYFHPDYQRRFIRDLRRSIARLYLSSDKNRIQSINILFLTHSPFILSDIPSENILLLGLDRKTRKSIPLPKISQTYAANINDLLANGFFLEGTLIGKFAEESLRVIIGKMKRKKPLSEDDQKVMAMVGDSFLKTSLQSFKEASYD